MTDFPEATTGELRALLSRRRVLRAAAGLGAASLAGPTLAACGTESATRTRSAQAAAKDLSAEERVVDFSNWPLYIDVDAGDENVRPTLREFTRRTGVRVDYVEDINDNDQFFGKIRPALAAGKGIDRDLIVLTDWMATRLIRLRWVQEIDHVNVPNLRNLQPALRNVSWDPQRDYTVPWQSGIAGLAYNATVTGPVRDMTELLTRRDLRGRVTALREMRDTIGLVLLQRGKDPAAFTDADFDAALGAVDDAVRSGQIRAFTGNDYVQDLASGTVAACVAWSGDIVQVQADNPSVRFVVPPAGALLFSDNLMIPNKATHKRNAEALVNYYYQPEVAAKLTAAVNYICPVVGAREELLRTGRAAERAVAGNPLIFPDEATQAKLKVFRGLDEKTERSYNDAYTKVIGS